MKIRTIIFSLVLVAAGGFIAGCQKGDLLSNPNVAAESSTVPASLLLNHITANLMRSEEPIISNVYKWNQNLVSNYSYYFGSNFYNWSNTENTYDMIKYCTKMEEQARKQYSNTTNLYFAVSKFFRAYAFIWLSQRVGDIPMYEAGNTSILTPKYDSQKEVYKNCLNLLDTANTLLGALISTANANSRMDAGDIYGMTYLQWQKIVNTYKLRVLISLSKRADDNQDLNIKTQFATIINNPAKYPIMTANTDNLVYVYNAAYNQYPINRAGYVPYGYAANINKTLMDIITTTKDPRTFAFAVPAPAQLAAPNNKTVGDFTAYVGADITLSQAQVSTNSTNGMYSFINWNRYFSSASGANCEPYIIIGYPELCFNIAEAANRGWITATASDWYLKGINASMGVYKLTQGQSFTVGNVDGTKPNQGTVTIDINSFLADPNVAYKGDNANGLNQILTQKYVAFFSNSGFEAFYNQRRTGVPVFAQGGVGIGTPGNVIPVRWQYPLDEITYNPDNYKAAITSQYGGTDDVNAKMWLIK